MKLLLASAIAFCFSHLTSGQSIVGTWQLVDEKTCFQSQMKESDTELELKDGMGASRQSVARVITFSKKGTYQEGIFSQRNIFQAVGFLFGHSQYASGAFAHGNFIEHFARHRHQQFIITQQVVRLIHVQDFLAEKNSADFISCLQGHTHFLRTFYDEETLLSSLAGFFQREQAFHFGILGAGNFNMHDN